MCRGAGFAGSAAVGYSMGNFVWYNQFSKYSAVLNVDIVNGKPARMSYQPVKIGGDGQPHAVGGRALARSKRGWQAVHAAPGLRARLAVVNQSVIAPERVAPCVSGRQGLR